MFDRSLSEIDVHIFKEDSAQCEFLSATKTPKETKMTYYKSAW